MGAGAMGLQRRRVPQAHRWAVVACAVLGLLAFAQASLAATRKLPSLGVRAADVGGQMQITWVQPAGIAWDAGVRPGDVVLSVGGTPAQAAPGPQAVASARRVQVRSRSGAHPVVTVSIDASLASARAASIDRRVTFFTLAACFMVVGAAIYVLGSELATGRVVFGLSLAAATALEAAVATPYRATWALCAEDVAVVVFCASVFLLFVVFPVNRLAVGWGRVAACVCLAATAILLGLYAWVLAANSVGYAWLEPAAFVVLAAEFAGAAGLAVYALVQRPAMQREVRPAMALIVLGILAGLAPFYLLTIVPRLFGRGSVWLKPEDAILSIVLLPIGLGAAVLSRQFPGITRPVRRGLVALAVWTMLVTAYTVGLYELYTSLDARLRPFEPTLPVTALIVACIGATFTPCQSWLRRAVERALFHDVYDYAEALERLSTEIARLGSIDAIASHVLRSLGQMLDLRWATIRVSDATLPAMVYRWGDCSGHVGAAREGAGSSASRAEAIAPMTELANEGGALVVPLAADEARLGLLAVGPKRSDMEYLPEDKALIATLAPLVTTALRNALLTRSLEQQVATLAEREEALAALTERLLQAHEEERRRIALDLHDDPLQRAILLTREIGEMPGDGLPVHVRRGIEEIVISLRAICMGLRPPMLDDLGLVAALEWLATDVSACSDLSASLEVEGFEPMKYARLETGLEVALYRVAQEALANCVKHARARQVRVTLQREARVVRLLVADDGLGVGDIADGAEGRLGLGLLGMRERLRPWGGTVRISANPAGGTQVSADAEVRGDYA
jgi:signal transduction histidine kinase